ncbi:MAG TPA: exodeoxyribonuclease VII small subunit [Armatimonadota bacterium]
MEEKCELSFEEALSRLEDIVRALESGEKPLNESLQLFEEGVGLARQCSVQLDDAKGRLDILVKSSDGSVDIDQFNL